MPQWFINVWSILKEWFRSARNNAQAVKESRTLPVWLAATGVTIDFALMHLWFRSVDLGWGWRWFISCVLMFLARLAMVSVMLGWACQACEVSANAIGVRPATMVADFWWSLRICVIVILAAGVAIGIGLAGALMLGMRLPAPPQAIVDFVRGDGSVRYFVLAAGLGALGNVLVVVTEELIYRSLLLPPLIFRFGLYPAVLSSAIIFGLAHVVPFGAGWIPLPQIVGGMVMAAGFLIRWSVVPAMVIHLMGNMFAGACVFAYVYLFQAQLKL
jgi:membrane protease YdiL (CAAX protease family)